MSKIEAVQSVPEIIPPNHELSNKIAELNTDIKYSTAFALGGTALTAAGVGGAYSMISGEHVAPVVDDIFIGSTVLTSGLAMGGAGIKQSISLRKQRRQLKKQERQELTIGSEHYQQNQKLYQQKALENATAAGVAVNGWHLEEK